MTPDKDFAAWMPSFEARIRTFIDLTQNEPILTNVRWGAELSDYTPITNTKNGYVINWDHLYRYCDETGYIRKTSADGETTLYRFDKDTGYYLLQSPRALVIELINGIKAVAPDMCISSSFPTHVELNIINTLRTTEDLANTQQRKDMTELYRSGETIPFSNGIYSLKHNKLLPRTSYVFIEHPLNVAFNPEALGNPIRQRYMDMMCGDEDLFELLFEQMGYILFARSFIVPTCTILYGGGSNGKSIVSNVLTSLVGSENKSALTLSDMTNAFTVAQTEGKMVNISPDSSPAAANSSLTATSNIVEFIKKSTSGELHTFNPKNGRIHDGYGPRKFVFATNLLLSFGSMDGGLARRMYIIPFRASFRNDTAVEKSFYTKDAKEWFAMQSLVSMMCMIYRRIGDEIYTTDCLDGEYLVCDAASDMKAEQMAAQDTVLDWLSTEFELDIQNKEEVRKALIDQIELFTGSYVPYCSSNRRTAKTRKSFNSTLMSYFNIGMRRTHINGETVYVATDGKV